MKNKIPKSEVEQFRLPADIAKKFRGRCDRAGKSRSQVLRILVERWLRKTDEIIRLKEKSK